MSKLTVNGYTRKDKISKEIYGHFSEHLGRCIYGGIYVGEDSSIPNVNGMRCDVVEALKEIKIPVLRWPGGCFADEYHWKDGIGPKENRKKMINTHWGGVVEDNSFGTHEFMELCRQLECEPYINGNVGSGTVQEMSEWVEYMTFDGVSPMSELRKANGKEDAWKLKYFGIGNENWGCGGNMRPEYYGDLFRRFQTYVRNYGDNVIYRIACGANIDDYNWTEGVMKVASRFMNAITLHYYTHPLGWELKGSATKFDNDEYYMTLQKTLRIDELISKHLEVMDKYDPEHNVDLIIDEWGTWFTVEPGTNPGFLYQQNTMRDAIVAAINLNIFNKHCDRVKMANIAQVVNVLQSVILTEGDKMIKTPTYHVFNMYKNHQEATLLESKIETENIGTPFIHVCNLHESASISDDGTVNITVTNLSCTDDYPVEAELIGINKDNITATILTDKKDAYNTFENPDVVAPKEFKDFKVTDKGIDFTAPACSVILFTIKQ